MSTENHTQNSKYPICRVRFLLETYPVDATKYPLYDTLNQSIYNKTSNTFIEIENSAEGFKNALKKFHASYDMYGFTDDERRYLNCANYKVNAEKLFSMDLNGNRVQDAETTFLLTPIMKHGQEKYIAIRKLYTPESLGENFKIV